MDHIVKKKQKKLNIDNYYKIKRLLGIKNHSHNYKTVL